MSRRKNHQHKNRKIRRILNHTLDFFGRVGNINKLGYGTGLWRTQVTERTNND